MGLKLEHVSYLYGTDTELLVRALDDVCLLYTSPSPRDTR